MSSSSSSHLYSSLDEGDDHVEEPQSTLPSLQPPLLPLPQSPLRTIFSRIINDPLIDNSIFPSIGILILAFLLILPIKTYLLIAFISFICGYSYLAITLSPSEPKDFYKTILLEEEETTNITTTTTYEDLIISQKVDRQIRLLLRDILDFIINSWYRKICIAGGTSYQDYIHNLLIKTIYKITYKIQISNSIKITSLLIRNLGNVFKIHLQNLRDKELKKEIVDAADVDNNLSFNQIMTNLNYFSLNILRNSLPKEEFESKLLRDLLIDLISGSVFLPLLDRISEPNFINELIISSFSTKNNDSSGDEVLCDLITSYTESLIITDISKKGKKIQKEEKSDDKKTNSLSYSIKDITLEIVLRNNDFFIEFMDYLRDVEAPPYLNFLINLDALQQYTRMAFEDLPEKSRIKEFIFSYPPIESRRTENEDKLRMIRQEATDLFLGHFDQTSKSSNLIPIPASIRDDIIRQLDNSDNLEMMDLVGHEIYSSLYDWILNYLRKGYFIGFIESEHLKVFLQSNTNITESLFDINTNVSNDSTTRVINDNIDSNDSIDNIDNTDTREIIDELELTNTKRRKELEEILRKRGVDELLYIDLQSLTISIKALIIPTIKTDSSDKVGWIGNLIGQGNSSSASIGGGGGAPLFTKTIEISLQTKDMRLLTQIIKNYSDILSLHKELSAKIPKVSRIPFPSKDDSLLFNNLQQYLSLLFSDELIIRSGLIRKFIINNRRDRNHTIDSSMTSPYLGVTSMSSLSSMGGVRERSYSEPNYEDVIGERGGERERVFWVNEGPNFEEKIKTLRQLSEDLKEIDGGGGGGSQHHSQSLNIREVTDEDIEIIIESIFSIIIEAFDIGHPSQWLRLNLFTIFKQIVKQAYGDSLSKTLTKITRDSLNEGYILRALARIRLSIFTGPNGEYVDGDVADNPPPKSKHRLLSNVVKAKHLWLSSIPESIYGVAGRYNTIIGMSRVFQGFQNKINNQKLLLEMAKATISMLLVKENEGQKDGE